MKKNLAIFILILCTTVLKAELPDKDTLYMSPDDSVIFTKYISYIKGYSGLPKDSIIIRTAKFFLGTPYVAHTLEIEPEGLVINLRELDCTTFVENVRVLTATVMSGDFSFQNYCNLLKHFRYRSDTINDYTDRLHYTSDWIDENQSKGLINNVTRKCGGKRLRLNLYIMSMNTDSYSQLAEKPELIEKVVATEKAINARKHYYIPTKRIKRKSAKMHDGDVVGFVTTIPGIDISHVGIIYKEGKKVTFIHASSANKKVIINESSLKDYVAGTGKNTGIVLAR